MFRKSSRLVQIGPAAEALDLAMPAKPAELHQVVWDVFAAFSEPLEGARIPYMYLDVKGLVTTGTGNLIDPVTAALPLPWRIDGRPATAREIREDWLALKGEDDRRTREGERPLRKLHHKYAAAYTRCRLDDADIVALVAAKLAGNVRHLVGVFPAFAVWPADAQLAVCSMAWAVGPALDRKFPNLTKLARVADWAGCIAGIAADGHGGSWAAKIRETNNPGVVPRNKANAVCFANAAAVAAAGARVDALHWPNRFPAFSAAEAPTEPAAPQALAGPVSVADAIVSEALRDLSRE